MPIRRDAGQVPGARMTSGWLGDLLDVGDLASSSSPVPQPPATRPSTTSARTLHLSGSCFFTESSFLLSVRRSCYCAARFHRLMQAFLPSKPHRPLSPVHQIIMLTADGLHGDLIDVALEYARGVAPGDIGSETAPTLGRSHSGDHCCNHPFSNGRGTAPQPWDFNPDHPVVGIEEAPV